MAKPNYQFEKRKRDMDKKAKKEEKSRRKKLEKEGASSGDGAAETPAVSNNPPN